MFPKREVWLVHRSSTADYGYLQEVHRSKYRAWSVQEYMGWMGLAEISMSYTRCDTHIHCPVFTVLALTLLEATDNKNF